MTLALLRAKEDEMVETKYLTRAEQRMTEPELLAHLGKRVDRLRKAWEVLQTNDSLATYERARDAAREALWEHRRIQYPVATK